MGIQCGHATILKKINLSKHKEDISKKSLWHFVIALNLIQKKIANLYMIDDEGYHLETLDGINIMISSKNKNVNIYLLSKTGYKTNLELKVIDSDSIKSILNEIELVSKKINTSSHRKVVRNEINTLVRVVETKILNQDFNFENFITSEQKIAYGRAFLKIIENGEIFKLDYFSSQKRIKFDFLPKDRLASFNNFIEPGFLIKNTPSKQKDKMVLSRVKTLSSKKIGLNESWSKYDAINKKQICIGEYFVGDFSIDLGEKDFFINELNEKIFKILQFRSEIVEEAFEINDFPEDSDSISLKYTINQLSSVLNILSKVRFLNNYIDCKRDGFSKDEVKVSLCLKIEDKFFIVEADSFYHGTKEFITSCDDNDNIDLCAVKDRIMLLSESQNRVCFSTVEISQEESKDVEFMHDFNVVFEPLDIEHVIKVYDESVENNDFKSSISRPRTLDKIEQFIENQKNNMTELDFNKKPTQIPIEFNE